MGGLVAALLAAAALGGGGTAAPSRATVVIRDYSYTPRTVTVHVGQPLQFVNRGKVEHTVADVDAKGKLRSKLVKPRALANGQSQVVRFARPGLVHYVCTFHPTLMGGTVHVVG